MKCSHWIWQSSLSKFKSVQCIVQVVIRTSVHVLVTFAVDIRPISVALLHKTIEFAVKSMANCPVVFKVHSQAGIQCHSLVHNMCTLCLLHMQMVSVCAILNWAESVRVAKEQKVDENPLLCSRFCWKEGISHLALESLRISQEELMEVAGEKDIWATVVILLLLHSRLG